MLEAWEGFKLAWGSAATAGRLGRHFPLSENVELMCKFSGRHMEKKTA
jgi:hypothetical protein